MYLPIHSQYPGFIMVPDIYSRLGDKFVRFIHVDVKTSGNTWWRLLIGNAIIKAGNSGSKMCTGHLKYIFWRIVVIAKNNKSAIINAALVF